MNQKKTLMANPTPQTTMDQYNHRLKQAMPKPPLFLNCLKAFLCGGVLCALAELLDQSLMGWGLAEKTASAATLVVVIALTALVTGLGFYDRLGQIFGAGLAVPITGFANSMTAAAMDNKTEGWILGTASNSFKLAGAVIVMGTVSAFVVALIMLLFGLV